MDIDILYKNSKEKIPNYLVDFCQHLSVNQMAAGSRLPGPVMEFFSPFSNFSNAPYLSSLNQL